MFFAKSCTRFFVGRGEGRVLWLFFVCATIVSWYYSPGNYDDPLLGRRACGRFHAPQKLGLSCAVGAGYVELGLCGCFQWVVPSVVSWRLQYGVWGGASVGGCGAVVL